VQWSSGEKREAAAIEHNVDIIGLSGDLTGLLDVRMVLASELDKKRTKKSNDDWQLLHPARTLQEKIRGNRKLRQ
jgi:hypothetical protein